MHVFEDTVVSLYFWTDSGIRVAKFFLSDSSRSWMTDDPESMMVAADRKSLTCHGSAETVSIATGPTALRAAEVIGRVR